MKSVILAAALLGLGSVAAQADVVYQFTNPPSPFPAGIDTITVSDVAVQSGTLDFQAVCGDFFPPCVPGGVPAGWISGFAFPSTDAVATVDLTFLGNLLSGFIHVEIDSDLAWTYQGSGFDWSATFFNGTEVLSSTGYYHDPAQVPEPASIAVLLTGIAGLAYAQQKRRRSRVQRPQ
jgi:hypothetical protein